MEISTIKINGSNVNVIFNGPRYFFINDFFGLVCIAQRDEDQNLKDHLDQKFTLITGNSRCIGSRFEGKIISSVKRFINKSEQKYFKKNIAYIEEKKDLNKIYLDIQAKKY